MTSSSSTPTTKSQSAASQRHRTGLFLTGCVGASLATVPFLPLLASYAQSHQGEANGVTRRQSDTQTVADQRGLQTSGLSIGHLAAWSLPILAAVSADLEVSSVPPLADSTSAPATAVAEPPTPDVVAAASVPTDMPLVDLQVPDAPISAPPSPDAQLTADTSPDTYQPTSGEERSRNLDDPNWTDRSNALVDYHGEIYSDARPNGERSVGDSMWMPFQYLLSPLVPRQTNYWGSEYSGLNVNIQPGNWFLASGINDGYHSEYPWSLPYAQDVERGAVPEFKFGPLYLDVVSVGATALYSDLSSDWPYPEDGFIASLDVNIRAFLRLADDIYLTAAADFYYLPSSNKVGFHFFDDNNSFAHLKYQTLVGDWQVELHDEFRVLHRVSDLLSPIEVDEIELSGRYRLGIDEESGLTSEEFLSGDYLIFSNVVGLKAMRPIAANWRLWLDADHYDFWYTEKFDDHHSIDRFRAQLYYEGDWRWNPYLGYQLIDYDGSGKFRQEVYVGALGKLSPTLRVRGRAGYTWEDGQQPQRDDGFIWSLSVIHDINDTWRHSVDAGSVYWYSDFGDNFHSDFLRYTVNWRVPFSPIPGSFTRPSTLGFYVQWSENDYWIQEASGVEILQLGASAFIPLGDRTRLSLLGAYRQVDSGDPTEQERWLFRAGVHRNLGLKTQLSLSYQWEEISRVRGNLSEHLLLMQLRRHF